MWTPAFSEAQVTFTVSFSSWTAWCEGKKNKPNQTKLQTHASFSTFALMSDSFPPLVG